MRLTKVIREIILKQNEGFSTKTYYKSRNSEIERIYTIINGLLNIREIGNTSWSDSRYDKEWIADDGEVHDFLYKYKQKMNLDGIKQK